MKRYNPQPRKPTRIVESFVLGQLGCCMNQPWSYERTEYDLKMQNQFNPLYKKSN